MQELRERYESAKALGARANALKADVATLKATLERSRLAAAAADIAAGGDGAAAGGAATAADGELVAQMEAKKQEYRACFDELRDHKSAIEHLQKLLEQSRSRMAVRSSPAFLAAATPPRDGLIVAASCCRELLPRLLAPSCRCCELLPREQLSQRS